MNEIINLTLEEWEAKGQKLFGKDKMQWKFICPVCGNVQSVMDFKKYKDKGATPSDAYFNCIGRFNGSRNTIMDKKSPCDYTTGGLFNLSPICIEKDGEKVWAFDFYIGAE
jgi:hypothetical protein